MHCLPSFWVGVAFCAPASVRVCLLSTCVFGMYSYEKHSCHGPSTYLYIGTKYILVYNIGHPCIELGSQACTPVGIRRRELSGVPVACEEVRCGWLCCRRSRTKTFVSTSTDSMAMFSQWNLWSATEQRAFLLWVILML